MIKESAVKNDCTFLNAKKEVMIGFLLFILNGYQASDLLVNAIYKQTAKPATKR